MDIKKIVKLAVTLAVVCIISAGLLAYVYSFTLPIIENNARINFKNSLKEVLPEAEKFTEKKVAGQVVYQGEKNRQNVGTVAPLSPKGYSGEIRMLVGIDKQKKIVGIKVLDQKETPGLGANVTSSKFLNQFIGKSKKDDFEPKKDIDAITGATISSRAVSQGVKAVLEKIE